MLCNASHTFTCILWNRWLRNTGWPIFSASNCFFFHFHCLWYSFHTLPQSCLGRAKTFSLINPTTNFCHLCGSQFNLYRLSFFTEEHKMLNKKLFLNTLYSLHYYEHTYSNAPKIQIFQIMCGYVRHISVKILLCKIWVLLNFLFQVS